MLRVVAVVVALLVGGNAAILAAHAWFHRGVPEPPHRLPVPNLAVVDDRVLRGGAPSATDYPALADAGVTTVVDLRAERDLSVDEGGLAALGIHRVHLPVRDGQVPSEEQVQRFVEAVDASTGRVYLHCGAGVGRTGSMAAAYLVATGQAAAAEALRRNLAVGPPSLEQLAFTARLAGGTVERPPIAVVALSRALDAPRRLWVHVRRAYV